MPIAKFQLPDGRIARFEVPDGTTPEQAQSSWERLINLPLLNRINSAKETSSREMMTHNAPKERLKICNGVTGAISGIRRKLIGWRWRLQQLACLTLALAQLSDLISR